MKRRLLILVVGLCCTSAALAAEYDYFRNARYPGKLREDVGRDTIKQAADQGGEPGQRVVQWWPKRGVDLVDVPVGVPLRTWTLRTAEEEPLVAMGYFARWQHEALRGEKQFKAHLLGFRGVGSELGSPFDTEAAKRAFGTYGRGQCPAVVLRLADGRKRCFPRGSLSNADQEYVTELYVKEMARIRKSLENLPRPTANGIKQRWPQGEIYKPGTFRIETQHFTVNAGAQNPVGGSSPWVDAKRKKETTQYRNATLGVFEDFWAYLEYAGQFMPHWEAPAKNFVRYFVDVPGTMKDGFGEIPGHAGGGAGGCGIRHAAWNALFHEWGHGTRGGGWGIGGGETLADSMQPLGDPHICHKAWHQVNRPHKNFFHGMYPGCYAYITIADDPNWGYAFSATVSTLAARAENSPMHTIARLGRDRGLWKKGEAIRGMGDLMAQCAARMADFDVEVEAGMRQTFTAPLRHFLHCLDREEGLYRCRVSEAPEPFGCNIVLLKPDAGAKEITVDFRGHFDAATHSDWRACIVGVDNMGRCRYSPLWNKGEMSFELKEGDRRHWLVVTATPTALLEPGSRGGNLVYEQSYFYKYPYDVKLKGCRPVGPNLPVGVNDNGSLNGPDYYATQAITGGPRGRCFEWPHPIDTPEYARMKERLEVVIAGYPAYAKLLFDPELFNDRFGWMHNRVLIMTLFLEHRANYLLDNAIGARHPNGGGWVAKGCTVAPTAYVGADCMVLDGAQVLDNAILEGNSIVSGKDVVIKDNARLSCGAVVCGAATVSGYARLSRNISNRQMHLEYNREGHPSTPDYEVYPYSDKPIFRDHPERRSHWYRTTYVGLEANYGMDREETVLLEDLFQERNKPFDELIHYDGVLYGKPGFAVDGERRGYVFDGKNQYGELDPMIADFGEITVDVALKPGGRGEGTIFDFGSSADNCFMLAVNRAGKADLITIVDGKQSSLTAPVMPAEAWTTVRVEIDGKTMAIFYNNKKVASRQSSFRPPDVFPGGCEKRNFIAATRDGKDCFNGTIDHVRIYSVIHDDFERDGIVPELSSRRVDASFIERFETFKGLNAQRLKAWQASAAAMDAPSVDTSRGDTWHRQVGELRKAREGLGKERVAELTQKAEAFKEKLEAFRDELGKTYDARRDVAQKQGRAKALNEQIAALRNELDAENTELPAARKLRDDAQRELRKIEDDARKAAHPKVDAANKNSDALNKRYRELADEAKAGDAEYQAAVKAVADMREKERALPKETPKETREALRVALRKLEQARSQEDRRVVSAPAIAEVRQAVDAIRRKVDGLRRRAAASAPGRKDVQAKLDAAGVALRFAEKRRYDDARIDKMISDLTEVDVQHERDEYVRKGSLDMFIELKKKEAAAKGYATRVQMLTNADEHYGLGAWYSGNFGKSTKAYLGQFTPFSITENENTLQQALDAQQGKWTTVVNWDSRRSIELGGRKGLEPHQLRWLQRMKPYDYE